MAVKVELSMVRKMKVKKMPMAVGRDGIFEFNQEGVGTYLFVSYLSILLPMYVGS